MTDEELLGEVEDLLRNMPERSTIRHELDENFSWLGRVSAVIEEWDKAKIARLNPALSIFRGMNAREAGSALREIITLLHQARHALRMKTVGPISVVVGTGSVFDYFDEIRKILEAATSDIFIIDPYLDVEFVSRYLGSVKDNVNVRMLAREKLNTLIPSAQAFTQQHGTVIEIRSCAGFHDRFIIIDNSSCYQSGASFKDGAKKSPTTLTQITDAFTATQKTYEDLWANADIKHK